MITIHNKSYALNIHSSTVLDRLNDIIEMDSKGYPGDDHHESKKPWIGVLDFHKKSFCFWRNETNSFFKLLRIEVRGIIVEHNGERFVNLNYTISGYMEVVFLVLLGLGVYDAFIASRGIATLLSFFIFFFFLALCTDL